MSKGRAWAGGPLGAVAASNSRTDRQEKHYAAMISRRVVTVILLAGGSARSCTNRRAIPVEVELPFIRQGALSLWDAK
jgi:hypothetical protein